MCFSGVDQALKFITLAVFLAAIKATGVDQLFPLCRIPVKAGSDKYEHRKSYSSAQSCAIRN